MVAVTFDNPQEALHDSSAKGVESSSRKKVTPMFLAMSQKTQMHKASNLKNKKLQDFRSAMPIQGPKFPKKASVLKIIPALESQRGVILSETPRVVPPSKILRREQNSEIRKGNIMMVKRIANILKSSASTSSLPTL
jgi:hypothetical protein